MQRRGGEAILRNPEPTNRKLPNHPNKGSNSMIDLLLWILLDIKSTIGGLMSKYF